MRPPLLRAALDRGITVDLFAGGGGASTGMEAALARPIDIAINHCPEAIAMHAQNHPETKHYLSDIWEVDPREATAGRPVAVLWASPDCKDFSRAKGAALDRSREVRALAWVVVRWAELPEAQRPRVILLENVEEFAGWGPLDESGKRIAGREGETFRAFIGRLSDLGYTVDYRPLVAADYGTPTTRKRLFLVARCDGQPIVWPEPTHGKGRAHAWQPAAGVIDWSLACPSIFDRKKPLAENTQRRIAVGIERYVLSAAEPFLVPLNGEHGHAAPRCRSITRPVPTVIASSAKHCLVAPTLIQTGYGERPGQAPRALDLHRPLGTVVGDQKHALVAAFISKHYGGPNGHFVVGHEMQRALGSVTGRDSTGLTTALIVKQNFGQKPCHGVDEPLHTVTTQHNKFAEVRAFLTKFYGTSTGADAREPLPTVLAGGNRGGGHLGLVMVHGEPYAIADIGMRMLQPHELFAAQGFPREYVIDFDFNGKPLTKEAKIMLAGNSVCPDVAEALCFANVHGAEARAA